MPKIEKQVSVSTPAKAKPIIGKAVKKPSANGKKKNLPVDEVQRGMGIKLLTYGRAKTGKTRLACTFPKPMILVGTEYGIKSVCTSKVRKDVLDGGSELYSLMMGDEETGVDFLKLESSSDLEIVEQMITDGNYNSAGLDHAGGLQDLILKEILGLDQLPLQKTWGTAKRETWGICAAQLKERLNHFFRLSERIGLDVAIVAHERSFKEEGDDELVVPSVGASLTPSAAGWLHGACDYICQTFIREGTIKKKVKMGKDIKEVVRKTGQMEYCLRIGPHSVFITGFRLPFEVALPEFIANPSYDKICQIIGGQITATS